MKIPSTILTLIAGILLTLVSLWYGQNHGLMPEAASKEASDIDGLFNFMMTVATGLFLIVEGALVFIIFKFRRRKGDMTDGPPIEGNVPLEIFWTAIPTVIVFILAIYSFEVYNNMGGLDPMVSHGMPPQKTAHHSGHVDHSLVAMDTNNPRLALGIGVSPSEEDQPAPLEIDVNGIQYAWIFTYRDTGIVSGELHIPVERPVQLNIKASDVIHAFWVPELRIKQDAIPGRDAELIFTSTRVGNYPIICAELCGAYHGGMKSVLHVDTDEDYNKWLQENTLAQAEQNSESVAVNPTLQVKPDVLAYQAKTMGIQANTLEQLHQHFAHSAIKP